MFRDLREFIQALRQDEAMAGQFKEVGVPVEKDWEITSIMRKLMFDNPKDRQPAVLFRHVKGFNMPVLVGAFINRAKYAYALGVKVEELKPLWVNALKNPIPPRQVEWGPCKENILKDNANLGFLPIPTWTPEEDVGPYISAPCVITRDPDTGIRNVGTYRMQVKGPRKTGLWINQKGEVVEGKRHIWVHYEKYEKRGVPMPVAVAIGPEPSVCMASVAKVPLGVDEFAVAGGLKGGPVEIIKCETVDLEVPAHAEIILEGEVLPGEREMEGPFGEMSGNVSEAYEKTVFHLKCITHRNNPIYHAYVSQKPPSESSNIRGIANEAMIYKHLTEDLNLPGILDVHTTESSTSVGHLIVKIQTINQRHAKKVLSMAAAYTESPGGFNIVSVVDEDIDIYNLEDVDWAYNFRVQPSDDLTILPYLGGFYNLDPKKVAQGFVGGKLLINATKKWPYTATALPKEKYLKMVEDRWEEYGL